MLKFAAVLSTLAVLAFAAGCASGVVGFALEVVLRKLVAPERLKNLQAASTLLGVGSYFVMGYGAKWVGASTDATRDAIRALGRAAVFLPTGSRLGMFGASQAGAGALYGALFVAGLAATFLFGSAALFAMVHPGVSALPVFFLGLTATVAFTRTRALATPMLVHAAYNAAVLAMNVYAPLR